MLFRPFHLSPFHTPSSFNKLNPLFSPSFIKFYPFSSLSQPPHFLSSLPSSTQALLPPPAHPSFHPPLHPLPSSALHLLLLPSPLPPLPPSSPLLLFPLPLPPTPSVPAPRPNRENGTRESAMPAARQLSSIDLVGIFLTKQKLTLHKLSHSGYIEIVSGTF